MGTNCSSHPGPVTDNICNQALGETIQGVNFCTLVGNYDVMADYCDRLSDGEWSYNGHSGTCNYDDCDHVTNFGAGCCGPCCGILGNGVSCKRTAFKGQALPCCLRDAPCTGPSGPSGCFQDSAGQWTCPPDLRDQASSSCQAVMFDYCTGTDLAADDTAWIQRWTGSITISGQVYLNGKIGDPITYVTPCYKAIYRNLYNGQAGACVGLPDVGVPTSAGFAWARNLVDAAITKYQGQGGNLISSANTEGNTLMNSTFWQICSNLPGLCTDSIYQLCTGVTSDALLRDISLIPWCGCFMPDAQYTKYTNTYLINKECTPSCNQIGVIPLPSDNGVSVKRCNQSTCIIDNYSISLAQSQVGTSGGQISFTQMCSTCAVPGATSSSCNCTILDTTVAIIGIEQPSWNVPQNCSGENSTCYTTVQNPDGSSSSVQIPCSAGTNYDPTTELENQGQANYNRAQSNKMVKVYILIFVALVIIVLAWFFFKSRAPEISIPPNTKVELRATGPPITTPEATLPGVTALPSLKPTPLVLNPPISSSTYAASTVDTFL